MNYHKISCLKEAHCTKERENNAKRKPNQNFNKSTCCFDINKNGLPYFEKKAPNQIQPFPFVKLNPFSSPESHFRIPNSGTCGGSQVPQRLRGASAGRRRFGRGESRRSAALGVARMGDLGGSLGSFFFCVCLVFLKNPKDLGSVVFWKGRGCVWGGPGVSMNLMVEGRFMGFLWKIDGWIGVVFTLECLWIPAWFWSRVSYR